MDHGEWLKNQIEQVVPASVEERDGVPVAQVVISYSWTQYVPTLLLDDEPAWESYQKRIRAEVWDGAKQGNGDVRGLIEVLEKPDEVDPWPYPENMVVLWFFGWTVKNARRP